MAKGIDLLDAGLEIACVYSVPQLCYILAIRVDGHGEGNMELSLKKVWRLSGT